MKRISFVVMASLLLIVNFSFGQEGSHEFKDGMNLKLDSSGKKYIHFSTWATFWARNTEANPGTAINGVPQRSWTDFSLRQFRFLTYSQINPRYLIVSMTGIDNQSFSTGGSAGGGNTGNGGATFNSTLEKKPVFYVHDFWNEYTVYPDKDEVTGKVYHASLYIGIGQDDYRQHFKLSRDGCTNL